MFIAFCSFLALNLGSILGIQTPDTSREYAVMGAFIGLFFTLSVPLLIHFPVLFSFPKKLKDKLGHFLFGYVITCALGLPLMFLILD